MDIEAMLDAPFEKKKQEDAVSCTFTFVPVKNDGAREPPNDKFVCKARLASVLFPVLPF